MEFVLARAYQDQGKLRDAIELYQKGLTQKSAEGHALYNLGNAYLAAKEPRLAVESFQKALDVQPQFPEALFGLGAAKMQAGDLNGAEAAFVKVVAADANNADAYFNWGNVLFNKGPVSYTHLDVYKRQALAGTDSRCSCIRPSPTAPSRGRSIN